MSKEVAILTLHGMGKINSDYADELRHEVSQSLGASEWSKVFFWPIFFSDILQHNQERVMDAMKRGDLDWIKLRKFLLFGFSDAAGLEHRAASPNSPYIQAQEKILDALDKAYSAFENKSKPVIIVAQSLGCQVISNYIWDAQAKKANQGIWTKQPDSVGKGTVKDKFRRLRSLKFLLTTGCNIPIFLAGFNENDIKAITVKGKGYDFRWYNYYDEDDPLGWPLKPLSKSYTKSVYRDKHINAGGLIQSWNPLSHEQYWEDGDFIKPLVSKIDSLL